MLRNRNMFWYPYPYLLDSYESNVHDVWFLHSTKAAPRVIDDINFNLRRQGDSEKKDGNRQTDNEWDPIRDLIFTFELRNSIKY